MVDRRHGMSGELTGRAHFAPSGRGLLYDERGTLTFGAHHGPAEQRLIFDFSCGNVRATVSFRDGRAFHDLDLSDGQAIVSHPCGPDLYQGRFVAINAMRWQSAWTVTGPRKDQEIFTRYTRLS